MECRQFKTVVSILSAARLRSFVVRALVLLSRFWLLMWVVGSGGVGTLARSAYCASVSSLGL